MSATKPPRIGAAVKRKVKKLLEARERGSAAYGQADAILEELLGHLPVGREVDLGDGRVATLVDNFAEKNKAWKPCGVSRFDLKVKKQEPQPQPAPAAAPPA